jgi:DNA-directed RNA polymerase subunit beta
MDQTNILSELENKRKVTAAGPGGILKERATFSIREVHQSHYSRFDPVTSPESSNIGVVTQLAMLAKVNEYGFLEAPYRKVVKEVKNDINSLINRITDEDVVSGKKVLVKKDTKITKELAEKITKIKDLKTVKVRPYITKDIEYFDALDEEHKYIGATSVKIDADGNILENTVPVRHNGDFVIVDYSLIDYVDVLTYHRQVWVWLSYLLLLTMIQCVHLLEQICRDRLFL